MPASELMAKELFAMLEEIQRLGSGQDALRLAQSIVSMAEGNMDVCETFFVRFQPGPLTDASDLFSMFLNAVAGGSHETELKSALLSVLSVAVRHCGLGVMRLRLMLEKLIVDGGWSPNAIALLKCMYEMITPREDPQARLSSSSAYAAAAAPISSGANWFLRSMDHFFILDGDKSGICLGGDGQWAWDNGYTWAASIWWDKASGAAGSGDLVLFRMVAGEENPAKQSIVAEVLLRGHGCIIIGIRDGSKKLEVQCPMELRPGRWHDIAIAHERQRLKTSMVTVCVDDKMHKLPLKYPPSHDNVRLYAFCPGWTPNDNTPGLFFRGLAGPVRVWDSSLSPTDAAKACSSPSPLPRPRLLAGPADQAATLAAVSPSAALPRKELAATPMGTLAVGGRLGFCQSLHSFGDLDLLLWLLSASVRLPVEDGTERAEITTAVLELVAAVSSEHEVVRRWQTSPRAERLLGSVTDALMSLDSAGKSAATLTALRSIVDCFAEGARQLAPPLAKTELPLRESMLQHWLLSSKVWGGVSEGVLRELFEEVKLWVQRDPESMIRLGDAGLMEAMLDMMADNAPSEAEESEQADGASAAKKTLKPAPAAAERCVSDVLARTAVEAAGGLLREGVSSRVVLRAREGARLFLLRCRSKKMRRAALDLALEVWYLRPPNKQNKATVSNNQPWALTTLSLLLDQDWDDHLAQILRVLVRLLSWSTVQDGQEWGKSGSYALLRETLVRRALGAEQQQECYRALLAMMLVEQDVVGARLQGAGGGQAGGSSSPSATRDWAHARVYHPGALGPCFRYLQVCDEPVRRLALADFTRLVHHDDAKEHNLKAIVSVQEWADRVLELSFGISGDAAGGGLMEDAFALLEAVVRKSMGSREGWRALRDVLGAMCRFRPAPTQLPTAELEGVLCSKARSLLLCAAEALEQGLGMMARWEDSKLEGNERSSRHLNTSVLRENLGALLACTHTFAFSPFTEENRTERLRHGPANDGVDEGEEEDAAVFQGLRSIVSKHLRRVDGRWEDREVVERTLALVTTALKLPGAPSTEDAGLLDVFCGRTAPTLSKDDDVGPWSWARSAAYLSLMVLCEHSAGASVAAGAEGAVRRACAVLQLCAPVWQQTGDASLDARATFIVAFTAGQSRRLFRAWARALEAGLQEGAPVEDADRPECWLAAVAQQLSRHVDHKELAQLSLSIIASPAQRLWHPQPEPGAVEEETGLEVLHRPLEKPLAQLSDEYGAATEEEYTRGPPGQPFSTPKHADAAAALVPEPSAEGQKAAETEDGGAAAAEGKTAPKTASSAMEAIEVFEWEAATVAGKVSWSRIAMAKEMEKGLRVWAGGIEERDRQHSQAELHDEEAVIELRKRCDAQKAQDEVLCVAQAQDLKSVAEVALKMSQEALKGVLRRMWQVRPMWGAAGGLAGWGRMDEGQGLVNLVAEECVWRLDTLEGRGRQRRKLEWNQSPEKYPKRDLADGHGGALPAASTEGASTPNVPSGVKAAKEMWADALDETASVSSEGSTEDRTDSAAIFSPELGPVDTAEQVPPMASELDQSVEEAAADEKLPDLMRYASVEGVVEDGKSPWGFIAEAPRFSAPCEFVTASAVVKGKMEIGDVAVHFVPSAVQEASTRDDEKRLAELSRHSQSWPLEGLLEIHGRHYLLQQTALELFFAHAPPVFFNFLDEASAAVGLGVKLRGVLEDQTKTPVEVAYRKLLQARGHRKLRVKYCREPRKELRAALQEAWVKRKLSNFEYLMQLNTLAGRSYNDLAQYPVFPWILADYTSEKLDLNNPKTFRDLRRPIGVQTDDKVAKFQERFEATKEADPDNPPFHYGTHYSNPGYVLWYLLRIEPFTGAAVNLQGGTFDVPDRMFWSIQDAYHNCTATLNDVKELVPEFFYLPEFLINLGQQDFGQPQSRGCIDAVELPPWANGSPHQFIRLHREALESEHVSQHLHHWIDLIFGYKQTGQEAEEAVNVFHYMSYKGGVDINSIEDPAYRNAVKAQIADFGQTPIQLFKEPHPARESAASLQRAVFVNPVLFPLFLPSASASPAAAGGARRGQEEVFGAMEACEVRPTSQVGGGVVYAKWCNSSTVVEVDSEGELRCWSWDGKVPSRGLLFTMDEQQASLKTSLTKGKNPFQVLGGVAKGVKGLVQTGQWTVDRNSNVGPAVRFGGFNAGRAVVALDRKGGGGAGTMTVLCGGHADGAVSVHAIGGGVAVQTQREQLHVGRVTCIALVEQEGVGWLLVTGGQDATVRLWRLKGRGGWGEFLRSKTRFQQQEEPEGERRVGLSKMPLVQQPEAVLCCHAGPVTCVAASESLGLVLSGAEDGTVSLCRITPGRCAHVRTISLPPTVGPGRGGVQMVALADEGDVVVYSADHRSLFVTDVNGAPLLQADAGAEPLTTMMLPPEGQRLLFTGNAAGQVSVWDVRSLTWLRSLPVLAKEPVAVTSLSLSPCRNFLLVGYRDRRLEAVTSCALLEQQSRQRLVDIGLIS